MREVRTGKSRLRDLADRGKKEGIVFRGRGDTEDTVDKYRIINRCASLSNTDHVANNREGIFRVGRASAWDGFEGSGLRRSTLDPITETHASASFACAEGGVWTACLQGP